MKRRFIATFALVVLMVAIGVDSYANSAQRHWQGVDSAGAVFVGEECPIEVVEEILTFDISEFPSNYYFEAEDYVAYSGRVTAQYTFHNPTDLTVSATLAFPFGNQPSYMMVRDRDTGAYLSDLDLGKYGVTVNGEQIEKRVRHTLDYSYDFELSRSLSMLSDGYLSDGFYSPDMTVTKYCYIVGGANKEGKVDEEKYRAACAAFDWDGGDGKTRLCFPNQRGWHVQDDGDARLSGSASNGNVFIIYAIGEPLSEPLRWKCYEDGGVQDGEEIDGVVGLLDTETLTLRELLLETWSEDTGVTETDWYNAALSSFGEGKGIDPKYNYVSGIFSLSTESFIANLMRWYEYEIEIAPRETIVNTVTAPIYPAIDSSYNPAVYSYTYLLSPASTWADFGRLEILINTPFYIIENSVEGFEKCDTGYTLVRDGLPEGELKFSLCSIEEPEMIRTAWDALPFIIIAGFILAALVVIALTVGAVTLIVLCVKSVRRRINRR